MSARATKQRKRRILFNWDGSDVLAFLKDDPTPEKYLERSFQPIDGSQVDTLLYCFGSGNTAEYASDVLERPGAADHFQFQSDDVRYRSENARKLADMGANPPEVISKAAHERGLEVFFSLRMNDTHDNGMDSEYPTFKREHPEWLVPQLRDNLVNIQAPGHARPCPTTLNFAVREVRELKLAVIREVFEKWDFDGIELDWSRHGSHFIPGTEYANRRFLTDFTREVRKIAEAGARRLGHPVYVFARVPETLHGCTVGGYDVAQWFREDLVDGLILGDMVLNTPYLSQFRDVMVGRPVLLYPSVYGYGMGYPLWDDATIRGVAANLWAAGADGLATYNLYPKGAFRRKVLRQIGSPETLQGEDKRYLSPRNVLTSYTRFSRHDCPASTLPAFLNVVGMDARLDYVPHTIWANVEVADDIPALAKEGKVDKVELTVGLKDLLDDDRLFISINGHSLTEPWDDVVAPHVRTLTWDLNADDVRGSQPGDEEEVIHHAFPGLRFDVPAEWLRVGTNTVQVLLLPTARRGSPYGPPQCPPVFVTRVELLTVMRK